MPRTPAPESAVIVRPAEALDRVDQLLIDKRQTLITLFGGDEAVADRMRVLTLHALSKPKLLAKLQKADVVTVIEAIRDCAALGLMPIGSMAEGYFVPYWNKDKNLYDLQFQPGYQGLQKLIERSGKVLGIQAEVAYENDVLEYELGTRPYVRHVPALVDRGNRLAVYCVAWLPGGIQKVIILPMAEVEQVRRASKARDDSPWVEWYDEMAKKTAVRRMAKQLPKDTNVERALAIENEAEDRYALPPGEPPRPNGTLARIHERLGIEAPTEAPAPEPEAVGAPVVLSEVVDGEVRQEPVESALLVCPATSKYDGDTPCIRPQGHSGLHRDAAQQTWGDTDA